MIKKVSINLLWIYNICFLLNSCKNIEQKNDCYEFNKDYSKTIEKIKANSDTILILNTLNRLLSNSACIDAYLTRGDIYLGYGNIEQAKKDYKSAILIDSTNTYAFYKIGIIYQFENRDDTATFYFQRALFSKKYKNGIIDYYVAPKGLDSKASKYDVDYKSILYSQGVSYYYLDSLEAAFNCFNVCINSNYIVDKSYLYRGSIYLEFNKKESACQDFKDAKKYGNKDADVYLGKYCK